MKAQRFEKARRVAPSPQRLQRPSFGRSRRTAARLLGIAALAGAALGLPSVREAGAFPHVVQEGESLAQIAERYYGKIQNERILVAANGLDRGGGTALAPGMLLEVPAVNHYRIQNGDTWKGLAAELLGASHRGDILALSNDQKPWIEPEVGTLIVVPYNLTLLSTGQDSLATIAYRYLGSTKKAWHISQYNRLDERELERGDVLLVPLTELALTEEGKQAAELAARRLGTQADAALRERQLKVEGELPALAADVRSGRYVEAVTRGTRLLSITRLSEPQLGRIHRQLLEAYVALDSIGQAVAACTNWRKHDANAKLDPVLLSPKILAACERAPEPVKDTDEDEASTEDAEESDESVIQPAP